MPVEAAADLRYTMSPDGQRLAASVEGVGQQELRVYDLARGLSQAVDRGLFVRGAALMIDPTSEPPRIDTLPFASFFVAISPDRRWIAIQDHGVAGSAIAPYVRRILDQARLQFLSCSARRLRWRRAIRPAK